MHQSSCMHPHIHAPIAIHDSTGFPRWENPWVAHHAGNASTGRLAFRNRPHPCDDPAFNRLTETVAAIGKPQRPDLIELRKTSPLGRTSFPTRGSQLRCRLRYEENHILARRISSAAIGTPAAIRWGRCPNSWQANGNVLPVYSLSYFSPHAATVRSNKRVRQRVA